MKSVPGAVATGLQLCDDQIDGESYPVATTPGTDLTWRFTR